MEVWLLVISGWGEADSLSVLRCKQRGFLDFIGVLKAKNLSFRDEFHTSMLN